MLFEQLAQFSPACTSVHRSEHVVPHREGEPGCPYRIQQNGLYFRQFHRMRRLSNAADAKSSSKMVKIEPKIPD